MAPEPRQGFEMILLRMLAFRPAPDVVPELDLASALEKKKSHGQLQRLKLFLGLVVGSFRSLIQRLLQVLHQSRTSLQGSSNLSVLFRLLLSPLSLSQKSQNLRLRRLPLQSLWVQSL